MIAGQSTSENLLIDRIAAAKLLGISVRKLAVSPTDATPSGVTIPSAKVVAYVPFGDNLGMLWPVAQSGLRGWRGWRRVRKAVVGG